MGKNRKSTKRQQLLSNFKRAVKRRTDKGINIPDDFLKEVNNMSVQRLSALSRNGYKGLDNLISKFNTSKVNLNPRDMLIGERISALSSKGYIMTDTPEKYQQARELVEYIMRTPYTKIVEAKQSKDLFEKSKANNAFWLLQKDPELFNSSWKREQRHVQPDDNNTLEQSTAVYDSIMYEIEEAYSGGTDAERFLATKLEEMLQEQINTYGFDKAVRGIEMADGWLLSSAVGYIYDSNQFVNEQWKSSLVLFASVIQGYIDNETLNRFSEYDDLLDTM